MRSETIDHLIRNGIDVTEDSIREIEESGFGVSTLEAILDSNSKLDSSVMNRIYDYIITLMSDNVENRISTEEVFSNKYTEISNRFDLLHRNVQAALEEVKIAQVLETNMSGYVDTVSIEFANSAVINKDETDAVISDGIVIGSKATQETFADKNAIRIQEYQFGSISAHIRHRGDNKKIRVEKTNASGIGYIPSADEPIINTGSGFKVYGDTTLPGEKKIDIIIDKADSEYFNQLEFKLQKAHLCMIYLSNDGLEYTRIFNKPKYIKNTIIPVEGSTARYVKVVVFKNSNDTVQNGNYGYGIIFNEFNILRSTINESVKIETNDIFIDGNYASMALETCCTYSNKNTSIDYYISIDGGKWNSVRPVNKAKVGEVLLPVSLPINQYTDNKMISITNFDKQGDSYISTLNLPGQFLQSNSIRVFASDITDLGEDWIADDRIYVIYGMLNKEATIDLGTTELELNGKWATGTVTLDSGVYKIRTNSENYANLFNPANASLVSENNGEYAVKDNDGITRTISDPLHPYNHKVIVENAFDFLFKSELIEKEDFTLYNNGSDYNISTNTLHDEVLIVFRLHSKNMTSFKFRAELSSDDNTTIPYLEKAIIRLA